MSDNEADGFNCYSTGDAETRTWFERQWAVWPVREHPDRTTNIAFLYGGIRAFRQKYGHDPVASSEYAGHVAYLDRMAPITTPTTSANPARSTTA